MGVIFRNGIAYGGGGGSEPIEAQENQILVGDGDDWAKGGPFKATVENGTINLEAQFDSQYEEGNLKNGIINIQGNFAKSGSKMPSSGSSWTQNVPCLTLSQDAIALFQNSYAKVVDSEICIAEGSEIHIDGDSGNTALPGTTKTNTAPKIRIHSNFFAELNPFSGYRQVNPYVNIVGGLYFRSDSDVRISSGSFAYGHEPGIDAWTQAQRATGTNYNTGSTGLLSELLSTKFGSKTFLEYGFPVKRSQVAQPISGFESTYNWQGPLFLLSDSPYFSMEGIPTFAMKDLAYFEMNHAASVKFDNQSTFEMTGGSDVKIYDNSCFHLLKNAWLYIDGNAGISMGGKDGQDSIFLTTYAEKQSEGHYNILGRGSNRVSPMYGQLSFLSEKVDNYGNKEDAVFSHNLTTSNFDLDGTLYIEKGFSAHFGSKDNGGSTALKVSQNSGHHVYLIEPKSGSTVFKFSPSDTTTAIITPAAPVHFKYSNSAQAYYSLSPNSTVEIAWQPAGPYRKLINANNYQERIEGTHYKDLWGNTRFIMRGEDGDDQEISQGVKQNKFTFPTEHGYSSGDTLVDMENYTTDGVNDKTTVENYLQNQYTGGNKRWGAKYDFNSVEVLDIFSEPTNTKWYQLTLNLNIPAGVYFDPGSYSPSNMTTQFTKINNGELDSLDSFGQNLIRCFGDQVRFTDPTKVSYVYSSSYAYRQYWGGITNAKVRVWVPAPPAGTTITDGMNYSDLPQTYKTAITAYTTGRLWNSSSYSYKSFSNWFPATGGYDSYLLFFGVYGSAANQYLTVSNFGPRTDMKYNTTVKFQAPLIKNAQTSFDQSRPIETASTSPTIQLYDSSNLVMRKSFIKEYYQEVAEDPIPVSAETLKQKLDWLKTTSYWTDFQTYLSDEGITYKNIYSISYETKDVYKLLETEPQSWTGRTFYYFDGRKYSSITFSSAQTWYQPNLTYYEKVSVTGIFIEYVYEKTDHDEVSVIDAPVFEQTGKSELRMHDGAVLKVEVNDCETSLTIGNGMDQSITFTFQELQALKALLSSSVTSTTINAIESVQTAPQSPVQGTVYIVEENNGLE